MFDDETAIWMRFDDILPYTEIDYGDQLHKIDDLFGKCGMIKGYNFQLVRRIHFK